MINMLLVRNPISSTKKFLKKTLTSFKSLFSPPSYQKLPKTPMDQTLTNTKKSSSNSSSNNRKAILVSSPSTRAGAARAREELVRVQDTKRKGKEPNIEVRREERKCFVARKIRELEMVDLNDIDHKLDIEEVLHYYSRLTCQPYLDLVDAFFVEVYAEFFDPRSIRG